MFKFSNFVIIIYYLIINNCIADNDELVLKEVSKNLWVYNASNESPNKFNKGLIANVTAIIGEKYTLVYDAGPSKQFAENFINQIKSISNNPIKYLIISHRHFDHAYGIEPFIKEGAKIYFDKKEFEYFKTEGPRINKLLIENLGFNKNNINFSNVMATSIHFFNGKSVIDLGYGDGRNFPLFQRLGLRTFGMEISDEIIDGFRNNQDLLEVMSFDTPSLLGDVGFKPGDVVLGVNGQKAYSQYQLLDLLMADAGQMKTVRVTRGDQEVELPFETPDVARVAVEQVVNEDEDGLSTPASKADVQAGDVIKSAAGVRVTSTRQLVDIIQAQDNKEFQLDLLRGDKEMQISITPQDNRLGVALKQDIGLVFKPEPIRYSKELAHPSPATQIGDVLDKIAITFKALGRGKESGVGAKDLSGPVGIFGMLAIQVNHDLRLALSFLVLLNINLAILNLLPVPVLDGGHILLSIIEWIRNKPVSVKIQEWATTAFAALLLCFFVYVTFADVKRVPLLHDIFNRDTEKVEQPVGSGE